MDLILHKNWWKKAFIICNFPVTTAEAQMCSYMLSEDWMVKCIGKNMYSLVNIEFFFKSNSSQYFIEIISIYLLGLWTSYHNQVLSGATLSHTKQRTTCPKPCKSTGPKKLSNQSLARCLLFQTIHLLTCHKQCIYVATCPNRASVNLFQIKHKIICPNHSIC